MSGQRVPKTRSSKTGPGPRRRESAPAAPGRDELTAAHAQPGGAHPNTILALQRRYGNRAVQRLIQPKLRIGPADDGYEREADRAASQVAIGSQAVPPAARGGSQALARTLQLKRSLVSMKTNTRNFKGPRTDNAAADVKSIDKAAKGPQFDKLEFVDLMDTPAEHVADASGAIVWHRIRGEKGRGQYIKSSKLMDGAQAGGLPGQTIEAGEGSSMGGGVDAASFGGTLVGKTDDALFEMVRKDAIAGTLSSGMNISEGATWAGASLLGMAAAWKDLVDDEKSAWDRVSAYFALVGGMTGIAGGAAQIGSSLAETGSKASTTASLTSTWLLGYQDMFNGLITGIKTIKNVVAMIKMVFNDKKYAAGQYVSVGGEILGASLETAKSVLRAIRHINEAISGTTGGQFAKIIPGLDIAIMAIKSITQGYYLAVSAMDMMVMQKRKQHLEETLRDQGYTQEKIKSTGKEHRSEEALTAKLSQMVAEKQAKIDTAQKQHDKIKVEGTAKQQAAATEKRRVLADKIAALKLKKAGYEDKLREHQTNVTGLDAVRGGPTRKQMEERELASDLAVANKRRVTRQAVHITTNLVQIGGSIAAIVSGPGAPAAVGLKLSAAGVDASLPFWRWIKQRGRDTAARNVAKGKTGLSNKIFNADKSDAAKLMARKKQAVLILTMVGKLHEHFPTGAEEEEAREAKLMRLKTQAGRVETYIRASGCPPEKLYSANGKPDTQIKILVEELSRRELG